MSLYGALFGGVSGLNGQSSKIAVVSDNIANVNTVGYKESEALFKTLVLNSGATTAYQTGGVLASSRMNVDQQGLLLSTNAPTDIAVSGSGFFTVNANTDGSGTPLYTRAGSFRQDAQGNFVNASGFYLQGWPLDEAGRKPGQFGNVNTSDSASLDSLETVNVESASGVAQETTTIEVKANLDAGESVYPGQGLTTTMDSNNVANFGINSTTIIAPSESFGTVGIAPANSIVRGDRFQVMLGEGLEYTYEYGGFTVSREITTDGSATNYGDGSYDNDREISGADTLADTMFVSDGAGTYTVTLTNHGLITGDQIVITNTGDATEMPNGSYAVTALSNNTFTFSVPGATADPGAGNSPTFVDPATTFNYNPFDAAGVIFNASSSTGGFFNDPSRFTSAALQFSVTVDDDEHTFQYVTSSPNTAEGQFNSLSTLAEAIDNVTSLTARIVEDPSGGERMMISGSDANSSIRFTNGEYPQTVFDEDTTGIDWVTELDLVNVAAGTRRFNTLDGLEELVDDDDGVTGVITDSTSNAKLEIRVDNPLDTITIQDIQDEVSFNIPADPGNVYYTITGTGPYVGGTDDIPVTLTLSADYSAQVAIGDEIIINGETAGLAGLPGLYPNVPGSGLARELYLTVTDVTATEISFTIPASQYSGTVTGPFAPSDASGNATLSVVGESNQGSLVSELFALTNDTVADPNIDSLANASYTTVGAQSTDVLGPLYDSAGVNGANIASGDVEAQFTRNVQIYDALGTVHDFTMAFIKIGANEWAVEIFAAEPTEITTSLTDGQIATGTITFNGDGSLRAIGAGLMNPINIAWTNGATGSEVTIDWGTAGVEFGIDDAEVYGDTDGLSQFDAAYDVDYVNQDGSGVGQLVGVTIDEDGFVNASYDNGEVRQLYKLPLAEFSNPNGLTAVTGNVFMQSSESGDPNLRDAGTSGTGDIVGGALEQSNVELSEQLTDLIVAQRAYQSNTRVISATDELLEQLNNL